MDPKQFAQIKIRFISNKIVDDSYTEYTYEISSNNFKHSITKRFSQFFDLYSKLARKFDLIPPKPQKKLFVFRKSVIKARRKEFKVFLYHLFENKELQACPEVLTFVGFDWRTLVKEEASYSIFRQYSDSFKSKSTALSLNTNTVPSGLAYVEHFLSDLNKNREELNNSINSINLNFLDSSKDYEFLFFGDSLLRLTGLFDYLGDKQLINGRKLCLQLVFRLLNEMFNDDAENAKEGLKKGSVNDLQKGNLNDLMSNKNEEVIKMAAYILNCFTENPKVAESILDDKDACNNYLMIIINYH